MGEGTGQGTIVVVEPVVDVLAMASIVHDMIAEGVDHIPSVEWLRGRIQQAGLGPSEYAALEALHDRLHTRGSAFLNSLGSGYGSW